jgi:hypothetical protein
MIGSEVIAFVAACPREPAILAVADSKVPPKRLEERACGD